MHQFFEEVWSWVSNSSWPGLAAASQSLFLQCESVWQSIFGIWCSPVVSKENETSLTKEQIVAVLRYSFSRSSGLLLSQTEGFLSLEIVGITAYDCLHTKRVPGRGDIYPTKTWPAYLTVSCSETLLLPGSIMIRWQRCQLLWPP